MIFVLNFEYYLNELQISDLKHTDLELLEWKWNRPATPLSRPRRRQHFRRRSSENVPTDTTDSALSEIESTTSATTATNPAAESDAVVKTETVVNFGQKLIKVIKKITKRTHDR